MTLNELRAELVQRSALIVHCTRLGRSANIVNPPPIFPEDLTATIRDLNDNAREICCSVIWPDHIKTFGDVGIVVLPRDTTSIIRIDNDDGGSEWDEKLQRRIGKGVPFSRTAVSETFSKPLAHHNEWSVRNADVVGLYVNPVDLLTVLRVPSADIFADLPDELRPEPVPEPDEIGLEELRKIFPDLPIYTFRNDRLVEYFIEEHAFREAASPYR